MSRHEHLKEKRGIIHRLIQLGRVRAAEDYGLSEINKELEKYESD